MTQFNIGSQNAANITNVGGDATIGSQHGVFVAADARAALGDVRRALEGAPLADADRAQAEAALDGVAEAVEREDEEAATSRLERLVDVLGRAGALAASGAALIDPLARLARVLGPLGQRVLATLPF